MANKIYALLVGIDCYHPQSIGVGNLGGCVNDIEAIEIYLRKRIATEGKWELVETETPWIPRNDLATRQAVINGFQQHLCKADSEDVVLFYYAGHGSYEPAPEVFWAEKPDRKIETLVCYDSKIEKGQDLADKELNYLIEQVASKNPHIVTILDCCHSGTATRDPDVIERQTSGNSKVRELKNFIFPAEWLNKRLSANYKLPRHIALAACRSHQTAKEYTRDGKQRGAFSYFLTEALQRTNGSLSYLDLVQDINALITGKVNEQSPQIEAQPEDIRQTFLGGATGELANYFTLSYDKRVYHSWVINSGLLHGVRPSFDGETLLAIFPQGSTKEQLSQISNAICRAKVSEVMTEASKVELFDDSTHLSQEEPYWAVVTDVPLPQLKVYFIGDDAGVVLAREALLRKHDNKPSLFVTEAESDAQANYYLEAIKGQYWIKQASDKHAIVTPIPEILDTQYTRQHAAKVIERLEHIARWQNILDLKTPVTSQVKPDDVEMEVTVISGDNQDSSLVNYEMCGLYTFKENNWLAPRVKVKITNNSEQDLYFQIVELTGSYAIDIPQFFVERSSLRLPKKSSTGSIIEGKTLKYLIPKKYLDSGITEYNSIFKLIVSTKEFNASLLEQPGLDIAPPIKRLTGLSGALNRLMNKVYTRETEPDDDENIGNWMSKSVKVTLIKPPGGVEIKESEVTNICLGVQLQPHQTFKGKFSLSPLPPNSRDASIEEFQFNSARDGSSVLSVLEIIDVQNYESVTPENPIKLVVNRPLSLNEYVLPIAYDGELVLHLGRGKSINGRTEITLESLPKPRIDSRSLQGSIKIMFQKLR